MNENENESVRLSKIKGVSQPGRQDNVKSLILGQTIFFEPEPSNKYDPNAVMLFADREKTKMLGYVDAALLQDMKDYTMDQVMVRSVGEKFNNYGANIMIVFKKK
jgi:hypothetical protein